MPTRVVTVPFILATCLLIEETSERQLVIFPPRIVKEPQKQVFYELYGQVELPCEAKGRPEPGYRWTKDGQLLPTNDAHITQVPGSGTLVIDDLQYEHEGFYQCFAFNDFGTAVTNKTMLTRAFLTPFESLPGLRLHRPEVGEGLTLECFGHPESVPEALTYWGYTEESNDPLPVEFDDRITMDYQGNLYFANVMMEDKGEKRDYTCTLDNSFLRTVVMGSPHTIQPEYNKDGVRYFAPQLEWSSETSTVAIKHEDKTMKCIFSGFPTPQVTWTRVGGVLPRKVRTLSHGMEILIPGVTFYDAGTYRCSASSQGPEPLSAQDFQLRVESMPFWVVGPEDFTIHTGQDVEFLCEAAGIPPPYITWFINGVPIEEVEPNERRTISYGKMAYRNVTKADTQVIQCNASNKHGYVFANAYLNVLSEADEEVKEGVSDRGQPASGSEESSDKKSKSSFPIAAVAASVAAVILICLLVAIVIIVVTRKKRKKTPMHRAAGGEKRYQPKTKEEMALPVRGPPVPVRPKMTDEPKPRTAKAYQDLEPYLMLEQYTPLDPDDTKKEGKDPEKASLTGSLYEELP